MSENSELTNPEDNGLIIETEDGGQFIVPPDSTVMDFVPQGGGERIGVLKIGQPSDTLLDGQVAGVPGGRVAPQFYVKRKKAGATAEGEDANEYIGPIPAPIRAFAVGIAPAPMRTYFASKYQTGSNSQPDCHSTNFMLPDEKFKDQLIPGGAGVIAHRCATIALNKQNKPYTKDVCPMAIGRKDPATGKWIPSRCTEQWLIALAFEFNGELLMVESYYKSTSRTKGKDVSLALRDMQKRSIPLWASPILLKPIGYGAGNSFVPELLKEAVQWDEPTLMALEGLADKWQAQLEWYAKSAKEPRADQQAKNEPSTADVFEGTAEPVNVTPQQPAAATNGNGAKPAKNGKKAVF